MAKTDGSPTAPRVPGEVSSVSVFVQIGEADVEAGRLYSHRRRGTESASFAYADRYLANPAAYPLDPALPLLSGLQQTPDRQRIFGAFSDSCPDRWGQRLIERAERHRAASAGTATRSLGAFDLLLRVRDDLRQGAIRYALGGGFVDDEVTGVPAMTDLAALLTASDQVASDTDDERSLSLLLRAGSSLGGARPKAHVRDANGNIAIAKFPSPTDEWNVMAWEKTALDLAAQAGISVPESSLHSIAGRDVLIVDRFDRTTEHQRRGYMSAMTALEATDGDTRGKIPQRRSRAEAALAASSLLDSDLQHRRPPAQPRAAPRAGRLLDSVTGVRPQPESRRWSEVLIYRDQ
jgi:serine/threonine-protein kinase HipA